MDPSELRKPYAKEMPALMRVRKTGSEKGMVPGYRTLNVLRVGREGRRGVLYHQLFSSQAEGFESESTEIQRAISTVGESLTSKKVTYLMDSQKDVQLMDLEAIRTLVALGWVAAGFLYELGVTLEWPEVQLLARLGGWIPKPNRPPGKTILSKGLQQLLDHLATEAILADEIRRNGALPPRIAPSSAPTGSLPLESPVMHGCQAPVRSQSLLVLELSSTSLLLGRLHQVRQ